MVRLTVGATKPIGAQFIPGSWDVVEVSTVVRRDQYAGVDRAADPQLAASPARQNAYAATVAEVPGPGIAVNRDRPAIGCDPGRLRRRLGPYALLSAGDIADSQRLKAVAPQITVGNELRTAPRGTDGACSSPSHRNSSSHRTLNGLLTTLPIEHRSFPSPRSAGGQTVLSIHLTVRDDELSRPRAGR